MAYSVAALAEAKQLTEAKAALVFQLQAQTGKLQDKVGSPYQIRFVATSATAVKRAIRTRTDRTSSSTASACFCWSLGRYHAVAKDDALISTYWPMLKAQIADALVSAIEPYSARIKADSSIWETHWNGKQREYTYTSLTAAAGLCAASDFAAAQGEPELARHYKNIAKQVRKAGA